MDIISEATKDKVFSLLIIVLPLALSFLHLKFRGGQKYHILLLYYIVFGIGIQGLASGIMQTCYSESVAQYVKWPLCPFMKELGLANISFGVLGILSLWMNRGWQSATAFGYALFLMLTGLRHAVEIVQKGLNPGDSGTFMYVDFVMSFILFTLLILNYKKQNPIKEIKDLPVAQESTK